MNPSILRRRGRATAILTTAFVALPFAPAAIAQPIDVPGLPGLPGIGEAAAPGLGDALEPGINAAVGANDAIAGAVNSARATGLPEDAIDPGAGYVLYKRIGDRVRKGEDIALLHHNKDVKRGLDLLSSALEFFDTAPQTMPLIRARIAPDGKES